MSADSLPEESKQQAPDTENTDLDIRAIFDEIDTNHNGRLEAEELKRGLQRLGLPHDSPAYLDQLLKQYDEDKDGTVDFWDFQHYVMRKERAIRRAFKALDEDDSGAISLIELKHALQESWVPLTDDDAMDMIHLLDRDGDDQINYNEFRHFVYLLPENQISRDNILFSWVDSADWMDGIEYRLSMTPPRAPLQRFLAGGVAGALSRASAAPFERLRTMMMAEPSNRHVWGTLKKMWADGGVQGMFKGNLATMTKVVPQTAVQFAVYDTCKEVMYAQAERAGVPDTEHGTRLTAWQHLMAGCIAGAAATAVTYPLETLRTHMAMGSNNYGTVAKDIIGSHGYSGLYQGFHAGLYSSIISNGLGFSSYEIGVQKYREWNNGRSPSPAQRGFIAGGSALVVMTAIMPMEVITRRLQIQGREGHPHLYAGSWECAKRMVAAEGLTSLYRGSLSSYMKVLPSICVVRFLYEGLMQAWGTGGIHKYRQQSKNDDDSWPSI
ncbi:hypothetical protein WJX73_002357 [Symbiochloris irregularis]|uniref:EF-hand domain-containing protein n=1 Tax=Symbiochloris irregularis TaxID=706552 RepID=A0AAW1P988_9CHLO